MKSKKGWIGVDLDHTLAKYKSGYGTNHIVGEPIPLMVERVRDWLRAGYEVRIFTARWCFVEDRSKTEGAIHEWLAKLDLPPLRVTNEKDYEMVALYDDRAVCVEKDTGRIILGPN